MGKVRVYDWASMRALSGSEDRSMKVWDLCTGMCIPIMLTGSSEAWSVDVDWDVLLAVSVDDRVEVQLWQMLADGASNGIGMVVLSLRL